MRPRGPGAHEPEAERGRPLARLHVEVVDDLHVVGDEADRRHDDVGHPLRPERVQVVEHVGLEPRLSRGSAPALVDERPRELPARAATRAQVSRSWAS